MESSLKEKLNNDLKQAMRGGDKVRRSVFRMVLSAIQNAEIASKADLENSAVIGVLAKEARQREESIQAFREGNRPDLAAQEEAELTILREYLPQQITRDEVIAEARRIIQAVGAQGPGDKCKVMSRIITELKGKADGREINEVVTELLGS
ncbi:MAG: GatB/YqeY domain-containing protein [Dehalococcoidales bacterium]